MRKIINIRNDDSYLDIALELIAFAMVLASSLFITALVLVVTISAIVAIA